MKRLAITCAIAAMIVMAVRAACAHGPQMMLGSTAANSGVLGLAYDFTDPIVVTPEVSIGGMTLFSSIFPGFEWLQANDPTDSLYVLKVGTPFSMQIVSIDSGASVMVGLTTLSAAGQSAFVATTTNVAGDHFHPQWQLLLADGVTGSYSVSFRLTTTSHLYKQSPVYTLTITNIAPTTTPTVTATSTLPSTMSPTPTDTPVVMPTLTPTMLPTNTATPTGTPAIAPATQTATETAVATATDTGEPTSTITPSPTATASATPSPTATETPLPLGGDANCDGVASAADLPAAVWLLGAPGPFPCGADTNGDGQVDESDVLSIVGSIFSQ